MSKWTYNPDTKVVTISQNGEFNLQIGEANWVVIKVEVGSGSEGNDGRKTAKNEGAEGMQKMPENASAGEVRTLQESLQ